MKMILAAALFACSITGAMAQQTLEKPDRRVEVREHMKQDLAKLNLTEDQKKPFAEISKKYAMKMRDLKDQNTSKEEKFKALKDLRDQKNAEIKGILKDDQYQTYLQLQEERTKKMLDNKKG